MDQYSSIGILLIILTFLNVFFLTNSNNTSDPFEWLKNIFDKGITAIEEFGSYLLMKIIEILLFVSRIVYITIGILGTVLWLSHLQPVKGRRMVIGALFLALITELLKAILI